MNLTNVAQLPDTFETAAGRVYVAGVGGSRRWAGSRRWRRILTVTGLRRTFAACLVGPTSVKIALIPLSCLSAGQNQVKCLSVDRQNLYSFGIHLKLVNISTK